MPFSILGPAAVFTSW